MKKRIALTCIVVTGLMIMACLCGCAKNNNTFKKEGAETETTTMRTTENTVGDTVKGDLFNVTLSDLKELTNKWFVYDSSYRGSDEFYTGLDSEYVHNNGIKAIGLPEEEYEEIYYELDIEYVGDSTEKLFKHFKPRIIFNGKSFDESHYNYLSYIRINDELWMSYMTNFSDYELQQLKCTYPMPNITLEPGDTNTYKIRGTIFIAKVWLEKGSMILNFDAPGNGVDATLDFKLR